MRLLSDQVEKAWQAHAYCTCPPVSFVLEPILKEPGDILFNWLDVYRTKNSLLQQFDLQINTSNIATSISITTGNETHDELGFYPKEVECEYRCPEIEACISSNLWCDGHHNCPSGFDESEEECGTARKLLELPGGVFAALGCMAAAFTACLMFCMFGLLRTRRKATIEKTVSSGGFLKKELRKDTLFLDPAS